jgi:predicted RNA-binding protein with PUA-like domain
MPAKPVRQFWLLKSEPDVFSIDDLANSPEQTTYWEGVRNYQARNFLRDTFRVGDGVLFYHSNADPLAVVGTAQVVRAGYPDHTAWDPKSGYYEEKCSADKPVWYMVDIQFVSKFSQPVTRSQMLKVKSLAGMMLLQRGSRLSVQPVSPAEWTAVLRLAGVKE